MLGAETARLVTEPTVTTTVTAFETVPTRVSTALPLSIKRDGATWAAPCSTVRSFVARHCREVQMRCVDSTGWGGHKAMP